MSDSVQDIERPQPSPLKVKCSLCGKLVKQSGLHDHKRDVHSAIASSPHLEAFPTQRLGREA